MEHLRDFKGVHQGKRLFVLASGPSLKTMDLSPLKRRLVMGLNRSFLAFPQTHYHCVMDHRLFYKHPDELKQTRYLFTLPKRPWGLPIKLLGTEGFSWDLEKGIYTGYTIAYFGLQVAVYMGFTQIFYLGLDLKLTNGQTHFFGVDFQSRDHEKTEFPRMKKMFEYGAEVLQSSQIEVYNCSPDTTLDCLPTTSYEYALSL